MTLLIHYNSMRFPSGFTWLEAKKLAQERRSFLLSEGYQPDGIKVYAGESWRQPYKSIERG